jgi:AAA family ATPase
MAVESPKKIPSTPIRRKESHNFASNGGSSLCLDPTTARSALADEKVNELLQTLATRWLSGRHLLKGNYVPLSMCGKLSLFVVMGAELVSSTLDALDEKRNLMSNVEVSAELGEAPVSFLVDQKTRVHLSDSVCSDKLGSDKQGMPSESPMYADTRNEDPNLASKLGGLSKESETIKGIISFSLADQIGLPRYSMDLYNTSP